MKVVSTLTEARADRTKVSALVPTMGALHEGHLGLLRQAKLQAEQAVLSIFVNPTQFGPNEDFGRYPRDLDRDLELAKAAGADLVFTPSVETMYASDGILVKVSGVSDLYEGEIRPGHFNGVATVVAKLFNIVQPTQAWFGLKDLQQCAVIRSMVAGLNMPVNLRFSETTREQDGLAMSSRNRYLDAANRQKAPLIYQILCQTKEAINADPLSIKNSLLLGKTQLESANFEVDYLDLVDWKTMHPVANLGDSRALIVAARLGPTRLIDNILFT